MALYRAFETFHGFGVTQNGSVFDLSEEELVKPQWDSAFRSGWIAPLEEDVLPADCSTALELYEAVKRFALETNPHEELVLTALPGVNTPQRRRAPRFGFRSLGTSETFDKQEDCLPRTRWLITLANYRLSRHELDPCIDQLMSTTEGLKALISGWRFQVSGWPTRRRTWFERLDAEDE